MEARSYEVITDREQWLRQNKQQLCNIGKQPIKSTQVLQDQVHSNCNSQTVIGSSAAGEMKDRYPTTESDTNEPNAKNEGNRAEGNEKAQVWKHTISGRLVEWLAYLNDNET